MNDEDNEANDNVITLPGGYRVKPLPEMIEMLERLLVLARGGDLQGLAGVAFAVSVGPQTFRVINDTVADIVMIGGIALVQHDLCSALKDKVQQQPIVVPPNATPQ